MFNKLPSLRNLLVFDPAVRLGSFKKAAGELSVTPAKAGSEPLQLFSDWLLKETAAPTTNRLRIDSD